MFKWLINVIILYLTYRTAVKMDKAVQEKTYIKYYIMNLCSWQ